MVVTRAKPSKNPQRSKGQELCSGINVISESFLPATRSLERSASPRVHSFDCFPDWLISVFLPVSPHLLIFLLSPPYFSTFACSLWGKAFSPLGRCESRCDASAVPGIWNFLSYSFSSPFLISNRERYSRRHWKSRPLYFPLAQIFSNSR